MNSIKHIRTQLGVTQAAMGEALGVTQGNVSNYENGQTVPPEIATLLIAYAKTLGLTITFNDVYALDLDEAPAAPAPHRSTDIPPEPSRSGRQPPDPAKIMSAGVEQVAIFPSKSRL